MHRWWECKMGWPLTDKLQAGDITRDRALAQYVQALVSIASTTKSKQDVAVPQKLRA